ncbi:MAG: DUF4097 family beta strand repeat-containing protein [Xanthomonadales bacterium]|nr:DUF4097 family beta strand repeat-containing protein [Xanthomonadales bacterium]
MLNLRTAITGSLLVPALLVSAVAMADVSDEQNFEFEVNPGAQLRLDNVNGDISISAWDANVIAVRAIKTGDDQEELDRINIVVDATEDAVTIDTKHGSGKGSWFNWSSDGKGSVEYIVQAPRDLVLRAIETVNGDIRIEDVEGRVNAETVNGDIETSGLAGPTELETVNGGIEADFDSFAAGQSAEFETVNGRIRVYLPRDISANISAGSVNGSIKNDFGLTEKTGIASHSLDGVVGDGDGELKFDTVNGSIQIRAK